MRIAVLGGFARSLPRFRGPMLRAMVAAGHEVVALAPEQDPQIVAELAAMGVAYRPVPLGRTGVNPLRDLLSLRALRAVFRDLRPDLLLSYTIKPVIYGSMAAAWAGVPHRHAMITGLGSSLQGQGGGLRMRLLSAVATTLYRRGLARVEGVFFQNPDDQAFFQARRLLAPGCRVTLINGSGVDLDHYGLCPMPAGPPTFLLVARLTRDKGISEFAEAIRILKPRHPQLRCLLVGGFDSNPTAIAPDTVAAWVAEGLLEFAGVTADVRPYLAQSQVFVLPSYGEGTPRSVLEAMSMGRAVVTTTAPGCRETVVDGQNGFLVPPRDPAALAAAMERFLAEPGLAARLGQAGRAYAEDRYDVHKVNAVILKALGI